MRFALGLKASQLAALLFDLPPPPVHLALSLHPFKLFLTGELTMPAPILDLLCALHVALPRFGAIDEGPAGCSISVRNGRSRLRLSC